MKKIITLFCCLTLITFIACKKDKAPSNTKSISAVLSGANETTPTGSTATGNVTGTFNTVTKELSITVTYSGITAVAAHIHKGAAGSNGGVVFGFTPFASPIAFSAILDATQEADLMAGLYYVNVHSAAFPGGEIRAQIVL